MKLKTLVHAGGVLVTLILPAVGLAANVTVNVSSNLVTVGGAVFGMGTAIYDNINGDPTLPGRIMASGVNTLRYSGGGYADIFHWSISQPSLDGVYGNYGTTPWWGVTNNYSYMGSQTDFGNFVHLLDNAQAQAVITVDYGSGLQWNSIHTQLVAPFTNSQPQEAAAWVAYANGDASLYGTLNDITIGVDVLGNDWKTVGFWAKLRSSTLAQYQSWAGASYDSDYNFLAINHPTPVGIKYWEIGNETFGTGYYDGSTNGYSVDYAALYTGTSRFGIASLSPASYGQQVKAFSLAMKAVDPTIKIGAVVSTPPGDYSWDDFNNTGERWTPQVLSQCATNIDFVIAHWYPTASSTGGSLLSGVGTTIPFMINGATSGLDTDTNAGLRDWINTYRPTDGTNVQIFITEFGYMGSVNNSVLGPVNALFCADSYATWMDFGVANIDWLELNKTTFLGDYNGHLTNGAAYYAIQMVHDMAGVGDTMVATTSDTSTIRAHAALQQSGKLGLLLINENQTTLQTVNVAVSSLSLSNSGTQYQLVTNDFVSGYAAPKTPPTTNTVSGLGNSFSVTLPPYSMTVLVIPSLANNTAPVLAPIGNQTVNVGQTVAFTASATDTDSPPQTLTFSLLSGPGNAMLNTNTGAFSWRPLVTQANTTNSFTLEVADNGSPSLSATQSFNVTVNPLPLPVLSSFVLSNGQITFLMSGGQTGPDYAVQVSTNLADWSTLYVTNSTGSPLQLPDTNTPTLPAQFYRIQIGPPLP
jgi:hypothetical protein